ncbi:MAG TPA: hypothetical protein VFE33_22495 [Thermoanaerobaculia bacterium]|nr:hypothetical protein [Thermoanaerobaculia bacterium]
MLERLLESDENPASAVGVGCDVMPGFHGGGALVEPQVELAGMMDRTLDALLDFLAQPLYILVPSLFLPA